MPHDALWAAPTYPNNESIDYTDRIHEAGKCTSPTEDNTSVVSPRRPQLPQSQQSRLAQFAMTSNSPFMDSRRSSDEGESDQKQMDNLRSQLDESLSPIDGNMDGSGEARTNTSTTFKRPATPSRSGSLSAAFNGTLQEGTGFSVALNDTPATTAPSSPHMIGHQAVPTSDAFSSMNLGAPARPNSGTSTPRVRPTTLDIPGLTKSKVSPDGRIAQRDVGAKLVIVMVGLPARGKSYITKKLARYLNWLQHDTRIFNVGEKRRIVAGGPNSLERARSSVGRLSRQNSQMIGLNTNSPTSLADQQHGVPGKLNPPDPIQSITQIVLNGRVKLEAPTSPAGSPTDKSSAEVNGNTNYESMARLADRKKSLATIVLSREGPEPPQEEEEAMEQNSGFFDPQNTKAAQIREQVARDTLDELLDYILNGSGSVGILDATNSTMERRKMVMDRIRERAGPQLNVLFLESSCVDQELLEANMRLKLNGPDYREMDPTIALEDFKKRVQEYEKAYVPLGEYEENNNMPYIQMIDVGRKVISHQIKGFLMAQANYYLLNFNLAPRQIWMTRHGMSMDNISGKIGGDSLLAPEGHKYARSLSQFIDQKRKEWDLRQIENLKNTHFPPQPGDVTPPNPYYHPQSPAPVSEEDGIAIGYEPKSFCVWTSMLQRSIQTAQYFNDEDYDTKQMRMLDELNAGVMEGLTYACISKKFPEEYKRRKADKLHYRYPGPGGEGYLDIINRLRPVIVELERMTDHVLLVGHRSVTRVLLAYFRGLKREEVADLDVPIGMLYCLEPKPYGVDFRVYRWDKRSEWFYELSDFELTRAEDDMQ